VIDAYRIGVHIGMTSNAAGVLSALSSGLLGVHVNAQKLQSVLGNIKPAISGAIMAFAGFETIKGVWSVVKAAEALNTALEKTKQLGGDFAKKVDKTSDAAFKAAMNVPTSTWSGGVDTAREIGATLGHPDAAAAMLEQAQKTAYVVASFTGESAEGMTKNLMRIADARAQIFSTRRDGTEYVDPAKLQAEMDAAGRGLILGSGFISSGDLLQKARMSGPAAKSQSAEAFYAAGVEEAIMLGASKAGTAEMGLFQQFIGGTMTKKVAEHLTTAGFLQPEDWHSGKSGGVVVNPGVSGRFEDMTKDPVAYFETGQGAAKIQAYAAKVGIQPMMAVFELFGRQTVQRLLSDLMTNAPQFARSREIFGGIESMQKQYDEMMKIKLSANIDALSASWTNFTEALGQPGIPIAIAAMHEMTGALHSLTEWAADPANQKIVGYLEGAAAGLGALAAALGVYLVGGAVMLAFSALTGPAGYLMLVASGVTAVSVAFPSFLKVINETFDLISRVAPEPSDSVKARLGDPATQQRINEMKRDHAVNLRGDVYLDGKKVGNVVAGSLADRYGSPAQQGSTNYDPRMSPLSAGLPGIP
jgi:hypothetical protein